MCAQVHGVSAWKDKAMKTNHYYKEFSDLEPDFVKNGLENTILWIKN
jgi:hypothetical protein